MSFLFGRRPRTNTVDLPKQAKEQIPKLDGPGGAAKVTYLSWKGVSRVDHHIGRGACKDIESNEIRFARNSRYGHYLNQLVARNVLTRSTRKRE